MAPAEWSNPGWEQEPPDTQTSRLWVTEFLARGKPPRPLPSDSIFSLACRRGGSQTVERNAPAP